MRGDSVKEFGVLKRVEPREVWGPEAREFTPWLAAHIPVLGDVLGMELELEAREAAVGQFSLDLLARDVGRNRPVVIENQLEPTDHDHLGKLLTYAAGYDAGAVVWISPEIREEHRQALDWLNQRTDANTDFFGVIVEVLQVDDSRPAYNFRLVAFPHQWRVEPPPRSPRAEAYRAFFKGLIDRLRDVYQFNGARVAQPQNWYSFASGLSGITYGTSFAKGGWVRAEVFIARGEADENKSIFDKLAESKVEIEQAFGEPLEWERLDDRQACRVAVYRQGTIEDDPAKMEEIRDWAIERLRKLKTVFGPRLPELVG